MNRIHAFITTAVAAAGIAASGVAFAQAPTPSAPSSSTSSTSSTAAQVETWTTRQWEAAKTKWAQNTIKWAGCQKQSSIRKLEGRDSWSFLYTCMTS